MAIQDQAFNPLAPASQGQMLGFVEPPPEEETITQRVYNFLIEGIRIADANDGQFFVKRLLDGTQKVWEQTQSNIFSLKNLWSVSAIPVELLQFMKNIVGWTAKYENITDRLDEETLRRLIAASVGLWKIRGTQDAIVSAVQLVTGARMRLWNWFDFRWITEETGFGHEGDGWDPWMVAELDTNTFNVRIMALPALDRQLVLYLIRLFRPTNERIEVTWLLLLDLFNVDGDVEQWSSDASPLPLVVADGEGTLNGGGGPTEIYTNVQNSDTWYQMVFSARLRGTGCGLVFLRQSAGEKCVFRIDSNNDEFKLVIFIGGVPNTVATAPLPLGYLDDPEIFYAFRVQVSKEFANTRILCYVDGEVVINYLDAPTTHDMGAVGFLHINGGELHIDHAEVLALPADTDFIDINT